MSKINGCKNNYDESVIMESFGTDDSSIKKCNSCSNFVYENGCMKCSKVEAIMESQMASDEGGQY